MPALRLEQRKADHWIEEPREEITPSPHHYIVFDVATLASKEFLADTSYVSACLDNPFSTSEPDFRLLGAHYEANFEQAIWNLFRTARMKLAREGFADLIEKRESERLIEEFNEAYDEEMEQEDKEFAQRTKGYYRRLLSTED